MITTTKKISLIIVSLAVIFCLSFIVLSLFFDEAVLVRKGTFYHAKVQDKVVALTFDDGPSPVWTPQILDELKKAGVKATFFMVGNHVERYPEIARRVFAEGHEIGNHTYDHHVLLYYTMDELEKEIRGAENAIKKATGQVLTGYFRPPKAWLTSYRQRNKKLMIWAIRLCSGH